MVQTLSVALLPCPTRKSDPSIEQGLQSALGNRKHGWSNGCATKTLIS